MTHQVFTTLGLWLVGGIALGALYMHLIARSVAAIGAPSGYRVAVGWLLVRFAAAAALLVVAALQGAGPVLAVLAGFLLARTFAIRRARET
jgi:hypothetical protein